MEWLLLCCGQWVSFPSPAQIAALLPQALQLQLLANGPRGTLRKPVAVKFCREDLNGETGPKEESLLESKKETADFLVGKK